MGLWTPVFTYYCTKRNVRVPKLIIIQRDHIYWLQLFSVCSHGGKSDSKRKRFSLHAYLGAFPSLFNVQTFPRMFVFGKPLKKCRRYSNMDFERYLGHCWEMGPVWASHFTFWTVGCLWSMQMRTNLSCHAVNVCLSSSSEVGRWRVWLHWVSARFWRKGSCRPLFLVSSLCAS